MVAWFGSVVRCGGRSGVVSVGGGDEPAAGAQFGADAYGVVHSLLDPGFEHGLVAACHEGVSGVIRPVMRGSNATSA